MAICTKIITYIPVWLITWLMITSHEVQSDRVNCLTLCSIMFLISGRKFWVMMRCRCRSWGEILSLTLSDRLTHCSSVSHTRDQAPRSRSDNTLHKYHLINRFKNDQYQGLFMFKDQLKTSKVHKNDKWTKYKNFIIKPKHPDNNLSDATKCI